MAIDIKRSFIGREVGNKPVDASATFEAGQIASYASDGELVLSDSTSVPCGMFKWNKTTQIYGAVVAEAVTLTGTTASNLDHANVHDVKVTSTATGGTVYNLTTDYTANTTNGTITRVATGQISSGQTVYVFYTYQKTTAEMDRDGKNFLLTNDDSQGSNKMTIIQGMSTVYTDQFETNRVYAVNDAVYASGNGKLTNAAVSSYRIGRVVSIPTAADPYLGIEGDFSQNL